MTVAVEECVSLDEVRREIRARIALGYYTAHEIAEALLLSHGEEWMRLATSALSLRYDVLRQEINKQLSYERRKVDRETPSQRRVREERARDEFVASGVLPEGATVEDFTNMPRTTRLAARIKIAVERFQEETIRDFFTDLLVPQNVPGVGWKRRADLTYDDCIAISESYEKRAVAETGMAHAFASFADAIQRQGVTVMAEVNPDEILGGAR